MLKSKSDILSLHNFLLMAPCGFVPFLYNAECHFPPSFRPKTQYPKIQINIQLHTKPRTAFGNMTPDTCLNAEPWLNKSIPAPSQPILSCRLLMKSWSGLKAPAQLSCRVPTYIVCFFKFILGGDFS